MSRSPRRTAAPCLSTERPDPAPRTPPFSQRDRVPRRPPRPVHRPRTPATRSAFRRCLSRQMPPGATARSDAWPQLHTPQPVKVLPQNPEAPRSESPSHATPRRCVRTAEAQAVCATEPPWTLAARHQPTRVPRARSYRRSRMSLHPARARPLHQAMASASWGLQPAHSPTRFLDSARENADSAESENAAASARP